MMDALFFYLFAALVLGGAIFTVTRRSAVHSAISLIVSLIGVAGLYLLQQAEFLFAVQIVLYVGGIMVLFLFVIMLVNLDQAAKQRQFNRQWWIALVCVAVVGVEIAYFVRKGASSFHVPQAPPVPVGGQRCRQHRTDRHRAVLPVPAAIRNRFRAAAGGGGRLGRDGEEEDLTWDPSPPRTTLP